MSSAALNDALVFLFKSLEGFDESIHSGYNLILNSNNSGNVHCSGEGIVGGLAHVDIIIGVKKLLACDLVSTVGNNFVSVHVGLSAASCLPYNEREVVVQASADNFVASLGNSSQLFICHFLRLESVVCHCSSLFEITECLGDLSGHCLDANADEEVLVASLGLSSPVLVCRNLYLAH